jgi:hypothetical protein
MKAYGGADVQTHIFLTLALAGGEWSALRSCLFTPGERALGTDYIGVWVHPRAGLDDIEKWILDSPLVDQHVASHYTDYAIIDPNKFVYKVLRGRQISII